MLLDNFEHLLAGAPLLAELLEAAPDVKALATSRSALRLSFEYEFPVPPLELPGPAGVADLESIGQCEAVQLFTGRASAVLPGFQLTEENAAAVAEITHRLDGLPLAIELAAARVKLLSPAALLERLDRRLDLLTSGARDLPARQQTLRDTLDWSYQLLGEGEQLVFTRLGVFVGSFSLEAAEALNRDLESVDVIETLFSLTDKSLLKHLLTGNEPRFFMLETVREYAQEKLAGSGDARTLWRLHAEYYLELSERAAPELVGHAQNEWLDLLEREHANLRAAITASLEAGELRTVARIGWNVWPFWWIRGHQSEGYRRMEEVLVRSEGAAWSIDQGRNEEPAPEPLTTVELARANYVAGAMAVVRGDYEQAEAKARACMVLSREAGEPRTEALGLLGLGLVALYAQEFEAAKAHMDQSLEIFRRLDDWWGQAHLLHWLWRLAAFQGRGVEQIAQLRKSAALFRANGDKSALVLVLHNLAFATLAAGHRSEATALLGEGLGYSLEIGNKWYVAYCLEGFGCIATAVGRFEEAGRLFGAAERLREQVQTPLTPVDQALYQAFQDALARQNDAAALASWREAGRTGPLDGALQLARGLTELEVAGSDAA